jgi:hypothetical protein
LALAGHRADVERLDRPVKPLEPQLFERFELCGRLDGDLDLAVDQDLPVLAQLSQLA